MQRRMSLEVLIVLLIISSSKCEQAPSGGVVVELGAEHTPTTVVGTRQATWKGREYFAFRGIPFARPPLGALRFRDPQALDLSLVGTIDARYAGHDCPSIYAANASEDCLTLNVYTQNFTGSAQPVLAFIHPGGLYVGSGLSSFIGAEYLQEKPLVLVTFNYRLGSLGFLSLGSGAVPGNAGFKDQVLALRWIRQHVRRFGGDPDDVTLMGYSAGGLSVALHLVSPMSRGLFHRAIAMSGALPPQTRLPLGEQMGLAQKQALALNCSAPDGDSVLRCLEAHSGAAIAATLRSLFDFGKDNPVYLWRPVVERDHGQERFLLDDYHESLRSGRFHRVPLLIGFTDGELCTSAAELVGDGRLERQFYADFERLAPQIFMFEGHREAGRLSAAIREHYLATSGPDRSDFEQLCNLFSDAVIRFGADRLATLAARHVPVRRYTFAHRGQFSNLVFNASTRRAEHLDDLMYLFRMEPHRFQPDDVDAPTVELYTNFIYDFITNSSLVTPPAQPERYALVTASAVRTEAGPHFAERDFWQRLFP